MKATHIAIVALAASVITTPARADDYAVSRIKYENDGAYSAYFDIRGKSSKGSAAADCRTKYSSETVTSGTSVTLKLETMEGDRSNTICNTPPGTEVWGKVEIALVLDELTRSCRKDNARFFFHPDGGTLKVFTKGAAANDNRCRIKSKGGVRWDQKVHGDTIYQD